jgi:hypothetical protein
MPTDDDNRRGGDRGHLHGIPNRIRNLIGGADDLALQQLTAAEYERMANAEQSIERLDSAKKELVLKVLARHETDWRLRLTRYEKICLDRGDGTEGSFQVSVALREMFDEEWSKYHDMMQRLDEAWQIHDELMRVAMERRGTDDRWPDED